MKIRNLFMAMIIGSMATVLIIPSLAQAGQQSSKKAAVLETSKVTMGSEAINQEVIQILRKGEMAKVTLNVVGQPGVYFKVEYSATDKEGSYALVPKGKGVIGSNGMGTVSFDLRKLGKEEVYLKVITSATADFAKPRVTPKPLALTVEQTKIKDRGLTEKINRTGIEEWRPFDKNAYGK